MADRRNQIASMTGFARADGQSDSHVWTFEVKSVNGRGLDVRFRLPAGFDALETTARTEIARRLRRGNVSVALAVSRAAGAAAMRINRTLLDQLIAVCRDYADAGLAPPSLDGLLAIRGVVEPAEESESDEARVQLEAAVAATLVEALERLVAARFAEGARLAEVLAAQIAEIERLTDEASRTAAMQPAALKERLRSQVQALLDSVPALPEERLAQEAALLIARADVREELDRLRAHVAAARELLTEGGAIGRRLDFLCQELNREANTLCSKSSDVELTRIGLALKAAIEQFREQVQNIE